MAKLSLLVSVSEEYLDQMPAIVKKLQAIGMTNIESMDAVGIITGLLEENKKADVHCIEGVAQVELSEERQVPPTDSTS